MSSAGREGTHIAGRSVTLEKTLTGLYWLNPYFLRPARHCLLSRSGSASPTVPQSTLRQDTTGARQLTRTHAKVGGLWTVVWADMTGFGRHVPHVARPTGSARCGGVYYFSGSNAGDLLTLNIIAFLLQRAGSCGTHQIEHYHDLGNTCSASAFFWATSRSAFMLLWYANIPRVQWLSATAPRRSREHHRLVLRDPGDPVGQLLSHSPGLLSAREAVARAPGVWACGN